MNTRETQNTFSSENMNRQTAPVKEGIDRAAREATDTYSQAKNYVEDKVQSVKKTVDSAASDASSTISKAVDRTMSTVNDGLEAGKQYIADQHLEKIADDVSGVIKKYPVQSLLAGIGMGIIIGNVLSRR